MKSNFLGLRSLIYPAKNLETSKTWWTNVLGTEPYFDSDGYVGFNVGGYEIGLNSWSSELHGPITYIGVVDIEAAITELLSNGATQLSGPTDVGEGILLADFQSPQGEVFGVIQNPHFKLSQNG